jgi:hypothetical protein
MAHNGHIRPSCIDAKITDHIWPSSPPPWSAPIPIRPPTPPPPGGGGSHGDSRWNATPGGGADAGFPKDREESVSEKRVLPRDLPVRWTVVAIAIGVVLSEGEVPGRCLVSSASSLNSWRLPYACREPPPRRRVPGTFLLKAPAPPGRGQYDVGIPGMQNPADGVNQDRYPPPLSVPVIENRCTSARCHLQWRDLPSLSAPFASSRETGGTHPSMRQKFLK